MMPIFRPLAAPLIASRHSRRTKVGQFVEVKPDIDVSAPITVDLGALPLSIGLFAGSGVSFLVKNELPKGWPQSVATFLGAGLAVGGVINLLMKRAAAAVPTPIPLPPEVPAGGQAPPPFIPPPLDAFRMIQFEIVSPRSDEIVDTISTGFLGLGDTAFPVTLRMYNPTPVDVSFNLEFQWEETPFFVAYRRPNPGSTSFQVTLPAASQENRTFNLPLVTSGAWAHILVQLRAYKKRTPAEISMLIGQVGFRIGSL